MANRFLDSAASSFAAAAALLALTWLLCEGASLLSEVVK